MLAEIILTVSLASLSSSPPDTSRDDRAELVQEVSQLLESGPLLLRGLVRFDKEGRPYTRQEALIDALLLDQTLEREYPISVLRAILRERLYNLIVNLAARH